MYRKVKQQNTTLKLNQQFKGESIEQKIQRIVHNKEPIKDGAPLIYTERKEGVDPAMDIRSDRFDIALGATDYISKSHLARREAKIVDINKEKGGTGDPSQ